MDLFDTDRKLSDLSDTQFEDFLEGDIFTPPPDTTETVMDFSLDNGLEHDIDVTGHDMDQDWLDTFFDPVLNDRMISDALQPQPHVQSEHSYSLANNEQALDMSIKKEEEKDLERELLGTTVNPNSMTPTTPTLIVPQSTAPTSLLTTAATRTISQQQQISSKLGGSSSTSIIKTNSSALVDVKNEPVDQETTMVTVTRTTNPHTLLKPTIILATQSTAALNQHHPQIVTTQSSHNITTAHIKQERIVLPKSTTLTSASGIPLTSGVTVKVEPISTMSCASSSASSPDINYDSISLPPTPPSSNTSDSEGCQSPERSLPSSPVRHSLYSSRTAYRATPSPPPYHGGHQPFLMNPIPSSGVLMLSEEEKRTLITEGYPIPAKLPLSKSEEKNLKKIRRKIKNKISAQESRRKKKEYLESLERKVESFCQENVDLKKKVDNLENSNRSLMSQLHKLQSLVGKMRPQNASVSGSCLMVLVLCFAVFLGSWSPSSLSVGYSSVAGSIATSPASSASPLVGPAADRHGVSPNMAALLGGLVDTVMVPGVAPGGGGGAIGGASINKHNGDGLMSDKTGGDGNLKITSMNDGDSGNDGTFAMLPDSADPYSTPNMKSRVLLSLEEESDSSEAMYGPNTPFCLQDMLTRWFSLAAQAIPNAVPTPTESDTLRIDPALPKINTLDVEMEINQTGSEDQQGGQGQFTKGSQHEMMASENAKAIMHPDISVMTPPRQVNATA